MYLCSRSSLQPKLSRRRYDLSYALQNISVFSRAQNWVSDIDESRTVGGSEFHIAVPEYEKLAVHSSWSYSNWWRGILSLLNADGSGQRMLQLEYTFTFSLAAWTVVIIDIIPFIWSQKNDAKEEQS